MRRALLCLPTFGRRNLSIYASRNAIVKSRPIVKAPQVIDVRHIAILPRLCQAHDALVTSGSIFTPDDVKVLQSLESSGQLDIPADKLICQAERIQALIVNDQEYEEPCYEKSSRMMRGSQTALTENTVWWTFREVLASTNRPEELQDGTDANDAKKLCAVANIVYQLCPEHRHIATYIWEYGTQFREKNCMFSLAQVIAQEPTKERLLLAASLYRESLEQGHPYSGYNLALMYLDGQIGSIAGEDTQIKPDYSTAIALLEDAVKQKVQFAITNLGNLYRLGLGTEDSKPDYARALSLYEKAASMDDPKATFILGNLYVSGLQKDDKTWFLEPNPRKAFEYWHRTAIIAQKSPENVVGDSSLQVTDAHIASQSLFNLGNCYFLGLGIEEPTDGDDSFQSAPSYPIALEFWELATKLDPSNLQAWLHVANVHFDGLTGGRPDYETALHYYEQAVSNGEKIGALKQLHVDDQSDKSDEEITNEHVDTPVVPIAELDNPSTADAVCSIANAMKSICMDKLNLSPTQSLIKDESSHMSFSDLLNNTADDTPSNGFVNPFKANKNVPDQEKNFLQGIKKRNFAMEAKSDAMNLRWRYVEEFSSQTEEVKSDEEQSAPAEKLKSTCNMM